MKRFLLIPIILIAMSCSPPGDVDHNLASFPNLDPDSPFYNNPELSAWKTASWVPFTVNDSISGFAYGKMSKGKQAGKDAYVAVSRTGVIGYSDNGDMWKEAEKWFLSAGDPFDVSFNAVAFGDDVFIAVGESGKASRSTDGGKSWTVCSIPLFGGVEPIKDIAYGEISGTGYFVAVGGRTNIAYSSDGGKNWSGGTLLSGSSVQLNTVVFGDETFYVAGDGGNTGYSTDLSSPWNHYGYTGAPISNGTINDLAYGAYRSTPVDDPVPAVAVLYNNRSIAIIPASNFAQNNNDWFDDLNSSAFGTNVLAGVVYGKDSKGDGYFVTAGQSAMIGFWPSKDKDNKSERYWRALPFMDFHYWEITAVAVANGRFFVGGIGGKIAFSGND
ncbi:hypothetical protein FACS1894172_17150 [Spirochaetia bacterium]|nr:hypothetical protein FACS1894172_17150 [Spirochaetia bacterium]